MDTDISKKYIAITGTGLVNIVPENKILDEISGYQKIVITTASAGEVGENFIRFTESCSNVDLLIVENLDDANLSLGACLVVTTRMDEVLKANSLHTYCVYKPKDSRNYVDDNTFLENFNKRLKINKKQE